MRAMKTTVMAAALLGTAMLALAGPPAPARAQPAVPPAQSAPQGETAPKTEAAPQGTPAPQGEAAPRAAAPAAGNGAPHPAAPAPGASTVAPAAAPATTPAAEAPPPTDPVIVEAREKMEAFRPALDSLEAGLAVEGLRASDLDDLRGRLDPLRRDLSGQADAIAPRLADIKRRLSELGPKPAADAPPENPTVTADREHLTALAGEFEAVLRQNRALAVRGDQISDRISGRRRALFTNQLFEQSESVVNPALWGNALGSLGGEIRAVSFLVTDWAAYIAQRHSAFGLAVIQAGAAAIIIAILLGGRFVRRHFTGAPPADGEALPRRRAARDALKEAAVDFVTAPLAILTAVAVLNAFDMIPPRADDVVRGFIAAVIIVSVGHGLARGVLAPGEPWRRLLSVSDRSAQITFRYYSFGVWALAISTFLNALHKTLFAPVSLTVVTSALMALVVGSSISRLLINLAREPDGAEPRGAESANGARDAGGAADSDASAAEPGLHWVRFLVWLALAALVGALVAGYVSFAAFVAARLVVAAAVLSGLFLLMTLVDVGLTEDLRADTPRAHRLSKTLGLKETTIELFGILIAGLIKVVLVLLAAVLIAGSWGTSTADVVDTVERMSFGVRIGNITLSAWNVVYAVGLLLVGLLIAKALQRWIAGTVLPRTGLEESLQTSIATIVGYVGFIAAIMASMNQLGLNLENVALVAGALSVGIGFGLQAIVSNFICGLILLAERPIRVGDTINVKGEEGYVRKISVRSTEIETYERATVIVPNSDLVTGMVKNWTHTNTTGRIIVTLNVPFDADAELVRDILVGCAYDHPQVLRTPPPRVFLSRFADVGMAFELRCVVANVDYSLTVRSDLHFAILKRFREAGIGFAIQPWASMARAPVDMVPPPVPPAGPPPEPPFVPQAS